MFEEVGPGVVSSLLISYISFLLNSIRLFQQHFLKGLTVHCLELVEGLVHHDHGELELVSEAQTKAKDDPDNDFIEILLFEWNG